MEQRCPLCHAGVLQELSRPDGRMVIQCSQYPACRFSADSWENVAPAVARFHHPVYPGQ